MGGAHMRMKEGTAERLAAVVSKHARTAKVPE
jgi:hypothetical protein